MGVTLQGKIFKSVVYYESKWFTREVDKSTVLWWVCQPFYGGFKTRRTFFLHSEKLRKNLLYDLD